MIIQIAFNRLQIHCVVDKELDRKDAITEDMQALESIL
jgi:hypothetical protein